MSEKEKSTKVSPSSFFKGKGLWIAAAVVLLLWVVGSFNGLVGNRENVRKEFANVQTQYQRRADLIPNLVSTVQGAADFEQETLTAVVDARAKATSTRIDAGNISPEQIQEYQAAQGELGQALSRLLVTVEAYPEIKANQNFLDLQTQLEGTENRIAVARSDFNEVAQGYNTRVQTLPTSIVAGIFGFDSFAYFEADQGAENAPDVNFN